MNIIIPLGGKGERFSKNGYTNPKPLIQIFEKHMIQYVLDNLKLNMDDKVFIIYNKKLDSYGFSDFITNKYPLIKLIQINDTNGAVETLFLGIDQILNNYSHHNKCLILDCDTFYTEDIIHIFKESKDNLVFYTKNYDKNAIYSSIGTGISEIVTLPICTIKTNFQNTNSISIISTIKDIYLREGFKSFYKASFPAIFSQIFSTSSKYVLYRYIDNNTLNHDHKISIN